MSAWTSYDKTTNQKLEVTKENRWKNDKIIERQKIKAIAIQRQKIRGEIYLSNEKTPENYKSDIGNKTYLEQLGGNDKYLL